MSRQGLIIVLLVAFVALSGLNYLYYHERIVALAGQAREAVSGPVTIDPIAKSELSVVLAKREFYHMVNHEVLLVILAIVGLVLLARQRR